MGSDALIEVVGYVASGLLVVSITQKSILRLRLIGIIAATTFLVYSLAIGAYPIAIVNVVVVAIHGWYLRRLIAKKDEVFRVLHVDPDSRYLLDFLDHYRDEIQGRFQPEFVYEPDPAQLTAFILRDMVPAGLFIGTRHDDGSFEVKLDFVIPQYRDFAIGRYVYSASSALFTDGVPTRAWADACNPDHAAYLRRMGFRACADEPGRFEIAMQASVQR